MCQFCQPLIKAIDLYLEKADDDLKARLKKMGYANPDDTVDLISELEDLIAGALVDETSYILDQVSAAVDLDEFAKTIWPDVQVNDELKVRLSTIFKDKFSRLMPNLTEAYVQKVDNGLYVTRLSQKTLDWVETWSDQLGEIMNLNSGKEIEKILTTGLKEGIGIPEFTRRIQESGIRNEYSKARTTAVTEVLRAHSVAQQEAFMQNPVVTGKMWRHSGTYKITPRENHVDMDGEVVPKDEPFTLYGADGYIYYPMYPRDTSLPPGESINCHCFDEPVVDEEILGLSLFERQQLQQEAIDAMDDEWEKELDAQARARAGLFD